jgi:excisionase family DNA binding protein
MDELLTTTEVGKLLKCNRDFVCKLIDAKLLPYILLGKRKIRKQSVNEFLKKYEGWDLSDPYNPTPIVKAECN